MSANPLPNHVNIGLDAFKDPTVETSHHKQVPLPDEVKRLEILLQPSPLIVMKCLLRE